MKELACALTIGAAVAVAGATVAAAEPIYNWTGVYIGGFAGGGRSAFDWHGLDGSEGLAQLPISQSFDGTAGFFGGYIGANMQRDAMVLGVELDYGRIHTSDQTFIPPSVLSDGLTFSSEIDSLASLRARLGYAMHRTLLYVTAGVCAAKTAHIWDDGGTFPFVDAPPFRMKLETGWVAGGGVEYALTSNISLRAEGLYYDLGSEKGGFVEGTILPSADAFEVKQTVAVGRVGLNLHF
jgi:outer membrane immunogenic protein